MTNSLGQKPFPELPLDQNFYLREQRLEDTRDFFEYYADPEVSHYILATIPTTLSEANDEIQYCRNLYYHGRGIYWTIARRDNDQMVGAVGLYFNLQHRRTEICYDLSKHYWNQGITTKAVRRVVEFCFTNLAIHRIEALTINSNQASMMVLKKIGFEHEGMLRNYRFFQEKPHDVELFGLTPEMFKQQLTKLKEQEA